MTEGRRRKPRDVNGGRYIALRPQGAHDPGGTCGPFCLWLFLVLRPATLRAFLAERALDSLVPWAGEFHMRRSGAARLLAFGLWHVALQCGDSRNGIAY